MNIYHEVEMLTLGSVPTVKIEVPIPKPVFPEWGMWVIGGLVVLGCVLLYLWIKSDKDKAKDKAESLSEIERLKQEDAKKAEIIAKSPQLNWIDQNRT